MITIELLKQAARYEEKLNRLSNNEIADLLIDTVLADMDIFSANYLLISQAVERLKPTLHPWQQPGLYSPFEDPGK